MQILVETAGGDKYRASDALKMLQDLNLTQQVNTLSGLQCFANQFGLTYQAASERLICQVSISKAHTASQQVASLRLCSACRSTSLSTGLGLAAGWARQDWCDHIRAARHLHMRVLMAI